MFYFVFLNKHCEPNSFSLPIDGELFLMITWLKETKNCLYRNTSHSAFSKTKSLQLHVFCSHRSMFIIATILLTSPMCSFQWQKCTEDLLGSRLWRHEISGLDSSQCYVAAWMGGEFGGEWIHTYIWLSPFTVPSETITTLLISFPGVLVVQNLPTNAGDTGDMGSIPESGRFPGGGHGNPLQYSCLENPRTEEPGGL